MLAWVEFGVPGAETAGTNRLRNTLFATANTIGSPAEKLSIEETGDNT
jgi:hypothetical protein